MSIYKALGEGPGWPSYRLQLHPTANLDLGEQSSVTLDSVHERGHIPGSDGQPVLEPHESFSYTVSSPSCPIPYFQRPLGQAIIPRATMGYSPPGHDYRFTRPKNDSGPATTAYSAITLTSPTSQQVPPSGEEGDESTEDDDEMLITCGKTGGEASENSVPKTAAERRAEKRKMKRFRYGGSVVILKGPSLLSTKKIDSQSNSFPYERVHTPCSSGRCTTGATF